MFPLLAGYIDELVARKRSGSERERLTTPELETFTTEYERLLDLLLETGERSALPEAPSAKRALNALLLRVRGVG